MFYQNLKFLFKIWSKLNSPQIFLAPLILRTIFMLRKLKLVKNHKRSIIALHLSYKLLLMTFVTGPLVCPLGRRKWRTSLRESAFRLRESINFYGSWQIKDLLIPLLLPLRWHRTSTLSSLWPSQISYWGQSECGQIM